MIMDGLADMVGVHLGYGTVGAGVATVGVALGVGTDGIAGTIGVGEDMDGTIGAGEATDMQDTVSDMVMEVMAVGIHLMVMVSETTEAMPTTVEDEVIITIIASQGIQGP